MAKKQTPAKPLPKAKAAPKTAPKSKTATPVAKPKSTTVQQPSRKPEPSKPAKSAAVKKENKPTSSPANHGHAKPSAREDLRSRILARTKVSKPIAFSLEEAQEIAKTVAVKTDTPSSTLRAAAKANGRKTEVAPEIPKPSTPHHVKAASLADILGFNPMKKKADPRADEESQIPERFKRYYKLLVELRDHVTGQLDTHTEETLKRSSKEDAGDLSSYGQHMADAGTDTFDRDFALSLVSGEQEALSEIDAAIQRIKSGNYGVCEATGKPISKDRLMAVPFTRYSAEAQKDIEKNRYRARQQAGLFGELSEDGAKIADEDSGDE